MGNTKIKASSGLKRLFKSNKNKLFLFSLIFIVALILIGTAGFHISVNRDYIPIGGGGDDAVYYVPKSLFTIQNRAINMNNPYICYLLGGENNNQMGPNRVDCIITIATNKIDKSMCTRHLKKEESIGRCYRSYAFEMKDETICSEIAYDFHKNGCIEDIMMSKARETNDLSYCLEIQYDSARYSCIQINAKTKEQCITYLTQAFQGEISHPAFYNYQDALNDCPR